MKCIDVSEHQGTINWSKVRSSGIDCAIIRAGYGKGNIDAHWKNNINGAIKAGIKHIGVYWFSYAYSITMAVAEANYCYKLIKPYLKNIDFGVYFDWEYDSMRYAKKMKKPCNRSRITDMNKAFCERIKALGIVPGFYYNWDFKKNYLDLNQLPYVNWYALDKSNGQFRSVALQQYGVESIAGISGKVDVNWVFEDVSKISPKKSDIPAIPKRGYFKKGDKGDAVKWIQKKLNRALKISDDKASKYLGLSLKVDGIFDSCTQKALKTFQDVRHIKVDGKAGVVTLSKLNSCSVTQEWMAVNWAVAVCRDDSFCYGVGDRAHHNGCYFCGTNINGPKKAKKGDKWEKTYCCNPFVHAAYAHGSKDPKMLSACQKKGAAGLEVSSWCNRFSFKKVGKCKNVPYKDLKCGDVILVENRHVILCTGSGWFAEASGESWDPKSISHKSTLKSRYKDYAKMSNTYVLRKK